MYRSRVSNEHCHISTLEKAFKIKFYFKKKVQGKLENTIGKESFGVYNAF